MNATTAHAHDPNQVRSIAPHLVPKGHRAPADFVETESSEQIGSALAYAQASGDMVCIHGGPGIGKTHTIRKFVAAYDNVWVATIRPATAAVVPALEEIALAVGLEECGGGARRIGRAIEARVRGLRGIIILDEAQHLSMAAIEEVRSLHDATGVAIALVGNETVYARLTGRSRASHFAQLFSRLGLRLGIPHPTAKDVRQIAKRWSVDEKGLDLLEQIASRPGALRAVVKVLRLAAKGSRVITADHIHTACARLGMEA